MHRYKDLKFWQESRVFCKKVYLITNTFPDTERFGLISQLRRASVSISSNIAEGCSRKTNKDFSRFLTIALGSCYEVDTQLILSNDLGFLSDEDFRNLQEQLTSIIKMMSRFNTKLNS